MDSAPTTLQQPQTWHLTAAQRLVDEYKLGPNGLGPEQLDELFKEKNSWRHNDFIHNYSIRYELGPTKFWGLIAQLSDGETSVGDAHQAIQSNESRAEHTAQALDDPNRNRSASANSRPEFSPESNRLKRVRSAGTDEDETTHAPLPGTSTDPSSKRKTPSSRRKTPGSNRTKRGSKPKKNGVVYTEEGRRQFVERFCPGQVTTSGQRQCEDSQTPFKYKQKWEDSFDKCCMLSYKLEPPIGKMKYRCVFVCDRKFETRSKLRNHVWDDHMATTDFSSSSHTQNQMQTVNCINTSLARDENAVLHTSPQNALTMDNSSHNGINGTAFVDNTNSSGLLPGSSVPPGTTPPDASMGTYQAPDTDTYNSLDFNLDLDFSDIDAEAILALNPHATNV